MTGSLDGKCALVTGAASGIGAAICHALAGAGARVHAADINAATATADAIHAAGGTCLATICDVSCAQSVAALFGVHKAEFGTLDIVVTAAGIMIESKAVGMDIADFDRTIAVNLRGTFLVLQHAARMMQAAGAGRIITISSELAHLGRADFAAYCASKSGVVGLTRSLARELAPNILVNSVAPGPVDTPMLSLDNMSPEWRRKELEIPLGRVGTPQEIAALVCFLAGPEAGFFTGQTISPNGGAAMY